MIANRGTAPAQALPDTDARDAEIAAFYDEHRIAIRRYLTGPLRCAEHEAEDIVQDTALVLRDRWDLIRTLDKPVAYWFKIAGRRFRRMQGQSGRHRSDADPHEIILSTPARGGLSEEIVQCLAIQAAFRELPAGQRQVLWLRYAADLSEAETADILNLRPGTVKSQLHDAKTRMKVLLCKHGVTWEAEGQ